LPYLREIAIEGLFGIYDHKLDLREDPPLTIVAGPNGIGKTTLLRLCTALLKGSFRELTRHEFTRLSIGFSDGARIEAEPIEAEGRDADDRQLLLRLTRQGARPQEAPVRVPSLYPDDLRLPHFIEPYGPDVFIDTRDGELMTVEELHARYGRRRDRTYLADSPDWFDAAHWPVDFIETKRLDTLITSARMPRHRLDPAVVAPINRYLAVVADILDGARRESARIYQARTSTVARRLLGEYSRKSVNAGRLRERYAQVERHAAVLTANGLLSDSLDVLPDENLNPTQKRFFEMFLDDFEAKLTPLDPVSAKIDQLRAIIEHKFLNKHLEIDPDRGVIFVVPPNETQITAESLSSGEQHELALISRLLFDEVPGTTVLIDEPELSLHVSWQHEMVEDLLEIAAVANVSFVLATHSTAIINGRWDIVEELGPLDPDRQDMVAADSGE
jgi:energy-coupling factor transporter ATP-binding protein EcfA2